ncbi:hypothetical protein GGD54_004371 [Rhizobium tropici]|uniref:Uncharacterized protein n=1 Tax=Rhizobium tropici TaxID=398 RepID=A0ABR6R432_RHITR|nr:hypothetical protein [Rhizobium tropici]MBB5595937.1 hypothetical protein [Rhizobium tropici]MBB6493930.1 hypothetical protein [Rhizobium tropici]
MRIGEHRFAHHDQVELPTAYEFARLLRLSDIPTRRAGRPVAFRI